MTKLILGILCGIAFLTIIALYYRLWVDCIINIKNKDHTNWKAKSMFAMSFAMVFNFVFLMTIFQRNILGYSFYNLTIPSLPEYWGNVVSFVILFIVPCIVINYLLIFYNNRYEILLKKYPYSNGKLFVTYFLISILVPNLSLLIGIIYTRFN